MELFDYRFDNLDKLSQRYDNVFEGRSGGLIECYRKGYWELRANVVIDLPGHSQEYHVVCASADCVLANELGVDGSQHGVKVINKIGAMEAKQPSVLIGNVEIMDRSKKIVPTIVRFEVAEFTNDIFGGFNYFSVSKRALKTIACFRPVPLFELADVMGGEWKMDAVDVPVRDAGSLQCLDGKEIKRTSELVDGFPDNSNPMPGDFSPPPNPEACIPSVLIQFNRKNNWISSFKLNDLTIDVRDVMFGPFNLNSRAA